MSDLHFPPRAARDALLCGRAVAFWVAIASPFVYLPLALAGLSTWSDQLAFAGLVVVHVIALLAGHPHDGANSHETDASPSEAETSREVRA